MTNLLLPDAMSLIPRFPVSWSTNDMDLPSGEGLPSLEAAVPDHICRIFGPRASTFTTDRVLAMSESFCFAVLTSSACSGKSLMTFWKAFSASLSPSFS